MRSQIMTEATTRTDNKSLKYHLGIIWALTAKDVLAVLKNKNTFFNIIAALGLLLMYKVLPTLYRGDEPPRLMIYEPDSPALAPVLDGDLDFSLSEADSQEQLMEWIAEGDAKEFAVIIPSAGDDGTLNIEGYALHWVDDAELEEMRVFFESQIADAAGRPVSIHLNEVYPYPHTLGEGFLAGIGIAYVLMMCGVTVVPHMMIEEKENKTLHALMLSPANAWHIVSAKALTGLFYTLICTGAAFILFAPMIVHWWLVVLAAIAGALFGVGVGLLLGILLEVKQQLTLWGMVILIFLLVPTFLVDVVENLLEIDLPLLHAMPIPALTKVVRVSFAGSAPLSAFVWELLLVLGMAFFLLAFVAWRVRRMDR